MRDRQGSAVAGVEVTLATWEGVAERTATTNGDGAYLFSDVAAGNYKVEIRGAELKSWDSGEVALGAGETREIPIVVASRPTSTTTVNVSASSDEIAVAQVQEEEHQRILGFLPNFYSAYWWDAAPMTSKLKFKLALRSVMDPFAFVTAAGAAGVEQSHKTFPGYGQGAQGFFKRYGAAYADGATTRMMSSAVFPALFHQDPRYFYRGSGSVRSRILYAVAAAVICRGDNGEQQVNYSHILGSFAAAGISNLYRDPRDRSAPMTFRNGFIILGGGAATNLMREFLSRRLTLHAPTHAMGKP